LQRRQHSQDGYYSANPNPSQPHRGAKGPLHVNPKPTGISLPDGKKQKQSQVRATGLAARQGKISSVKMQPTDSLQSVYLREGNKNRNYTVFVDNPPQWNPSKRGFD
jgi:hypothetical protein